MSRAKTIARYLSKHPGADLRQLTKAAGLDQDNGRARNTVAAQLSQLIQVGKATTTGKRGSMRYFPTALTLVDKRLQPGARAPKPAFTTRKPATPAAAKPQPATQPAPATDKPRNTPPKPPADSPMRASLVRMFTPSRKAGVLTSDDIAAQTADFLRRGGVIERLELGAASKPLRSAITDAAFTARNDASWRARQLRLRDTLDEQEADDDEVAAA